MSGLPATERVDVVKHLSFELISYVKLKWSYIYGEMIATKEVLVRFSLHLGN